ncbi:MAG: SNF2-related protein [Candidatus Hodarchaeales archaeon]
MIISKYRTDSLKISAGADEYHLISNLGRRVDDRSRYMDNCILTMKIIKELCPSVKIDIDVLAKYKWFKKAVVDNPLPTNYNAPTDPFDHQRYGFNFIHQKKRVVPAWGVGTGKSKIVIDAIFYRQKISLVVVPATLIHSFALEIEKHRPELTYIKIVGSKKQRQELLKEKADVHIINYDMLFKLEKELIKNNYGFIVFDECHKVKSYSTNQSKAAHNIAKNCKYVVGLSGTAIANGLKDLFGLYKVIDPILFGTVYRYFKERYLIENPYVPNMIVGIKNKTELLDIVKHRMDVKKLDDLVDLPPEIIVRKKIILSSKTQKIYNTLKKDNIIIADKKNPVLVENALEKVLRLSQITSGFTIDMDNNIVPLSSEKLDALAELLEETDGKIIIWARFKHSIKKIQELCKKKKYSYMTFDGDTKDKTIYEKFNKDKTRVWIAQISCSAGYSIPNAKYAYYYEEDYSRINRVQSMGRNRRLTGSEDGSCVYIRIMAEGTVDVTVDECLDKKDFTAKEAADYMR